MSEFFEIERIDHIATVTLDNGPLNLVTQQFLEQLTLEFSRLSADEDIGAVILTGGEKRAFCAGGDRRTLGKATIESIEDGVIMGRAACDAIRQCAVPVIGAINGPALGSGLAMAASCDILIASERATFGLPEVDVGSWPQYKYMARLLPEMEMRRLVFCGRKLSAEELYRYGSVSCIVDHDQLMSTAVQLAQEIASKNRFTLQLYKHAFNETEYLGMRESLPIEMQYIRKLLTSPQASAARKAFLERKEEGTT